MHALSSSSLVALSLRKVLLGDLHHLVVPHRDPDVAKACYHMAVRFHRGGRLVAFGNGGAATDAQHVAVEFVHPVIVGKRALPAFSLTSDVATVTGIAGREGFAEIF